jgi:hypothetical protein
MRITHALLATLVTAAALSGTPALAATPTLAPQPSAPLAGSGATTQGIIMRDGGICDPIRHMGC